MAAPNLVNPGTITSKTGVLAATTAPTAIVTNALASSKVVRVVSLIATNLDPATQYYLTADFYRGSTATNFAKSIGIPAGVSVTLAGRDAPIYLEEGDSVRLTASANAKIEAVCSYELVAA